MGQILNRISHINISFLCLFTVEDFFDKKIRKIDLITILHFLEYDNGTICNPRDVNHHNANTGDVTYIGLKRRCEAVVDDIQYSKTQDLPFRSFEFVLYKICDEKEYNAVHNDKDTFFEVTSTTSAKLTNKKNGGFVPVDEQDNKYVKAMKFISEGAANLTPDLKTGKHKVKDIMESIKRFQMCSKFRLGIVDGLHRLTAFSNLFHEYYLDSNDTTGSQYCNIEFQCNVYVMKQNIERKDSGNYQSLFKKRSQYISESAAKAMPHTLFDTITEIIREIHTRKNCNYAQDIENTDIVDFMKKITTANPHRSFCEEKYYDVFKHAQLKLLEDCKEYEKVFESRFFQLGRQKEKPKKEMYEDNYLKGVFHSVLTTLHTTDGIISLINGDIVQCRLHKKMSFSLSCASIHRFISAYMTFGDDLREEWILGFQSFQRCGLANFPSIQLTVAYAEVLATTLVKGFKDAKNQRDLNVGKIQFERILSNYFIIELMKGIRQMEEIPGGVDKILQDWGMTQMPKEKGEESGNKCCQWLTKELQTQISWQKNPHMTMMGIYFNYAKCILSQPFFAESDCGFVRLLVTKKKELNHLNNWNMLFKLPDDLKLEKRRSVPETPKCMKTTSCSNIECLPLTFNSFIRQIYRSHSNGQTIEVYQENGTWPIYHPMNVVQRYRSYKNMHEEKNKQTSKQMQIILSPLEKYVNYQEWYEDTEVAEDFTAEERSKISLRIISAIEATSKNIKIVSNILKDEKLQKTKQDNEETSVARKDNDEETSVARKDNNEKSVQDKDKDNSDEHDSDDDDSDDPDDSDENNKQKRTNNEDGKSSVKRRRLRSSSAKNKTKP